MPDKGQDEYNVTKSGKPNQAKRLWDGRYAAAHEFSKSDFDAGKSQAFEWGGYKKPHFPCMILFLAKALGFSISRCPEFLLRVLSNVLGSLLYFCYAPRRRTMLRSLGFSFPEKSPAWRRRIARTCCIRLIETGLMSLASPFFSEKRIRVMAKLSDATLAGFVEHDAHPNGMFLATMHMGYWEGLTWVPFLVRPHAKPEIMTVYRPLRNPALDNWLRSTRERFGMRLLSRRSGLHESLHALNRKACVSMLFDQSAGSHGYLTLFMGRECSTTPLPGMLVEKSGADLFIIYALRTSFWRFEVVMEKVESDRTPHGVTLALNRKLESLLRGDERLCESWLWLHQRWRILDRPEEMKKLEAKRGGLIG
jgi:lauroyl/myristoyl acyltransferase